MILHFVLDEKVTDQIIDNFDKVDKGSFFLVFGDFKNSGFTHITKQHKNLIKFNFKIDDITKILEEVNPKAILMHAFHLEFAKTILKIESSITIAWYEWGFDIYGLPRIKPHIYAPITKTYLLRGDFNLYLRRAFLKYKFLRIIYCRISKKEDRYSIIFAALKKVKYFVSYIEEDFEYFSRFYPNNLKFINCAFSTIEQYLAGSDEIKLANDARNILVGNSSAPESNHLDVLSIIGNTFAMEDTIVYTPLSYGIDSKYKEEVMTRGKATLGKSFAPLLHFMDRLDYISILKSCSVGIFYHYRQQAMGNIIPMLYLGARIYMSSKNPAYTYLVNKGIAVFNFDNDFDNYRNTRLEESIVIKNRKLLDSIFDEKIVLKGLENLVQVLS